MTNKKQTFLAEMDKLEFYRQEKEKFLEKFLNITSLAYSEFESNNLENLDHFISQRKSIISILNYFDNQTADKLILSPKIINIFRKIEALDNKIEIILFKEKIKIGKEICRVNGRQITVQKFQQNTSENINYLEYNA